MSNYVTSNPPNLSEGFQRVDGHRLDSKLDTERLSVWTQDRGNSGTLFWSLRTTYGHCNCRRFLNYKHICRT